MPVDPRYPETIRARVRDVAGYGANLLRIQINDDPSLLPNMEDPDDYGLWLRDKIGAIAVAADEAQAHGVGIIVSQHQPFGGSYTNMLGQPRFRCFKISSYQQEFVTDWGYIARQLSGHPAIVGYDLINEPPSRKPKLYMPTLLQAARLIRSIDRDSFLIFSTPYGNPQKIKAMSRFAMQMKELRRTWVTAHMYYPHSVTHQGLPNAKGVIKNPIGEKLYPDTVHSIDSLKAHLQPLKEWQKAWRIPVFIGEYSCIRWSGYPHTESAYAYLRDLAQIMKQYKWHFAYHAFEEAGMWRLDFSSVPCGNPHDPHCQEAPHETNRTRLMREILRS